MKPDVRGMVVAKGQLDLALNEILSLFAGAPDAPLAAESVDLAHHLILTHCAAARRAINAFEAAAQGQR